MYAATTCPVRCVKVLFLMFKGSNYTFVSPQVQDFLSNKARMRETQQMGVFHRSVKEGKGWFHGLKRVG
jgi:hypothetical protein